MIRNVFSLLLIAIAIFFSGCTDNALVDSNFEISNHNWSYIKRIKVPVTIKDISKKYNLYFNLRHTADYRYSNIFVLIRQTTPDRKTRTDRKEFRLAYPDGEWLGSGSGNIYSYQLPFIQNYSFPKPGTYNFEFEQNMRDNPLREVTDVGLRVEPVDGK